MKKWKKDKIMDMLTLDGKNKTFKINDSFYLESVQVDKSDTNIEISHNEPVDSYLCVKCKRVNNVEYNLSENIYAKELDEIISIITSCINDMMRSVANKMVDDFLDWDDDWIMIDSKWKSKSHLEV